MLHDRDRTALGSAAVVHQPQRQVLLRQPLAVELFSAEGRMLFGGSNSLAPDLSLEGRARDLRRRMLEFFPQLGETQISHVWSGRLGLTFDQLPHVGRENGVYYAYGFNGHGVAMASYIGHEVGLLIAGKITSSLFQQIKHERAFFAPLERLYMPLVSAGFRISDRFFT